MPPATKANVMFVDDEKRVLSSMRALFRHDYNVHVANSGTEALALLEHQEMDVIVSDQRMPGMTGVDVLKACRMRAPRAMRILLTGYADKEAIEASINEGEVFRYLTKPCPRETLKETLALAVKAAGVAAPAHEARAPDVSSSPAQAGDHSQLTAKLPRPGNTRSALTLAIKPAPEPRRRAVELLVLSGDRDFMIELRNALATLYRLHPAQRVQQALELLDRHPIGVVITDMAVNADEVHALTTELKHAVPELVTIVASDHSDAHRLIDLINSGQIFRFLLKPIKPRQTAIWIESAVNKHVELVKNPSLVARHALAQPPRSRLGGKLIRSLTARLLRLRDLTRLRAHHQRGRS